MRHPVSNATLDAGDFCVLGRKGAGKTTAAKGLVERLIKRGRRVIVLDPVGVWWGLRLAASGDAPGLPVVVVGGAHSDFPILDASDEGGEAMAKVLLSSTVSVVVDIADLKRPDNMQFVSGLLRGLYEGHAGSALTIVLEEADVFAPQGARDRHVGVVFGEVERLARRGRSRGFSLISISQRPARLHKDVLTQFDTMVVLAMPGRHDRLAIRHWLEGVTDASGEVYNSLPSLAVGEAWVWTPKERRLSREHFPVITTFDSSGTPVSGGARVRDGVVPVAVLAQLKAAFDGLRGDGVAGKRQRLQGQTATVAGAAIQRLREQAKLTQAELAELIGSEQKSVSRMESGRTFVSTRILERMAEKTGHQLRVEFVPIAKRRDG